MLFKKQPKILGSNHKCLLGWTVWEYVFVHFPLTKIKNFICHFMLKLIQRCPPNGLISYSFIVSIDCNLMSAFDVLWACPILLYMANQSLMVLQTPMKCM